MAEGEDELAMALASAATPLLTHGEKIAKYTDIAVALFSTSPPDASRAKRFMLEVPTSVSKRVMSILVEKLSQMEDSDLQEDLALYAINEMHPHVASFGHQVFLLRESMAGLYEKEGNFSKAADILIGTDFDSETRVLDKYTQFSKCVQIANFSLENADVLKAGPYLKQASAFVQEISDRALVFQYKYLNADYLDLKLQFLEAAKEYHELSKTKQHQIGTIEIKEEEMKQLLISAVRCALLSAACAERSCVLTMLSQDERSPKLNLYPVVQKVIHGEFLNEQDIASVEKELLPHHKKPFADNSTLLDHMMIEHNLLCIKNENNSSFSLFNSMLGIDPQKVTKSAAVMSASEVRRDLCSVKNEITKTQHTLQLQLDDYDAYVIVQPERRLHLDTEQTHQRAARGYSQLTKTIKSIVDEIRGELDFTLDSLRSEIESIDRTLPEP